MRLVDWAEKQGIAYQTAWKWFKAGKLPVPAIKTPTGMILVQELVKPEPTGVGCWVYARVSSHDKKADLEQLCRVMGPDRPDSRTDGAIARQTVQTVRERYAADLPPSIHYVGP